MSRSATVAAVATLLLAPAADAQDRTAEIDRIFSFATPETPGCAVGVSQHGKVVVNRAYGLANVERREPLGPRTRFDIGSTQKQFTAAAVLLLVADGRLALTDDVRKYLPELPDYGHTITVDHLLTHTSGVRDWTGMLPMAEEGTDVMTLILRQRALEFVPGEAWSYSTSGFELAKAIVARVSGMSFADFARTRLFAPLGMTASAYVPDIMQAGANAALGYQKGGAGWKPFMRLGANRGGGAIVSTVGDILVWNDALASGRLGPFVTGKLHERATLRNGRTLNYARGLMIDATTPGATVVSHSGGAAGFSTWMGRVPEHGLSVTVACNFDPVSATDLAGRVAELYVPGLVERAPAPAAPPQRVDVTGRDGLYFDARTGEPVRLTTTGGTLTIANGPTLVPVSADRFRPRRPTLFFRSQDAFELTFPSSDAFEIRSMEGPVTRYRRAQPWTPTAADLQAVDGRYESAELGSVFEIVPDGNGLVMRFERTPDKSIALTPVERDTYMRAMMLVRFRRDASGKVAGFDYGNPVVHGIGFTRRGDRSRAAPAAPAAPAPPLASLTGEYEIAPGRTLAITVENGQLHGQPSGSGAKLALTHVAGTTFSAADRPITLTFTLGADGRATALVMRQNGNERTLPKVR